MLLTVMQTIVDREQSNTTLQMLRTLDLTVEYAFQLEAYI